MGRRAAVRVTVAFLCIGVLLAWTGRTVLAQSPQPQRGGAVRIAGLSDGPTLNPAVSSGLVSSIMGGKIFSGLLEYDWDFVPRPSVAERWEVSGDGLTYTFHLRRDVTFHDGRPLTSADVKFTAEKVLKVMHPRGAANYGALEAVDAPDPHTVVFRLKQPFAPFIQVFHASESPILPRHVYDGPDIRSNVFNLKPVGSGPFKFGEWVKGSHVLLERNDKYFKPGQPYLDRVVWQIMPDAATRVAALETGGTEVAPVSSVPNVEVSRVRQLPNVVFTTRGYEFQAPIMFLEFNLRRAPLSDVRVRRAIAHAIDKEFVLKNIWFGVGKIATGPLSSLHKAFYTTEIPSYEYSLDKANRLLDEGGLRRGADGMRFKLTQDVLPYTDEALRFAEYARGQLRKIGIDVTTRTSDFPGFLNKIYTMYDFDFAQNWVGNMMDPSIGMPRYFVSTMAKPGVPFVNSMNYQNPEVDRLFAQAARELNADRRKQVYAQIQRTLMSDLPLLPVLEFNFTTFYAKDLENVVASPFGVYDSFDRTYWKTLKK